MQITFERAMEFANRANMWVVGGKDRKRTKLGHAIERVVGRLEKAQKKIQTNLQSAISDANIEFCEVDEKGIILIDEKGEFKYTKAGLKNRNAAQRAAIDHANSTTIEVEPYLATDLPKDEGRIDLTPGEIDAFDGFVLIAADVEAINNSVGQQPSQSVN